MKKINAIILFSFFILLTIPTAFHAETTKQKKLPESKTTEVVYALTKGGKNLEPADFIPAIEEEYQIKIKDISFSKNHRANTMTSGILKTELDFTTTSGDSYQEKLPYLIEKEKPTISIDDISYNTRNNQLSFKTSNRSTDVYMLSDGKIYTCPTDNNGFFKGKYNPHEMPTSIKLISFNDDGDYSDEYILTLKSGDISQKTLKHTAVSYNKTKHNQQSLDVIGEHRSKRTTISLITLIILIVLFLSSKSYFSAKRQN
ncbi:MULTISPECIES: hypothetical protein [Vagococcus]|uniref:Uncharacterized protein n=1 Tax=Vagococcus fluvialis bH819 TaxID=1255619 RepID=A0A1X6WPD8_9ENTE|nr:MULTISPECIES: hypothetical protein [Vagococcus]SLM86092.1 hypothetical protein FM121_08390 [Vagococcus fluvialis bH819]HCM90341.1 hypothetical protein [Vagococcus sp.]